MGKKKPGGIAGSKLKARSYNPAESSKKEKAYIPRKSASVRNEKDQPRSSDRTVGQGERREVSALTIY